MSKYIVGLQELKEKLVASSQKGQVIDLKQFNIAGVKVVNNYEFELNIPFDGNDVEVIKRENYGFKPKYGQCWLVRDCYVGLDLKEYSMPLNYRKLKLTGNN